MKEEILISDCKERVAYDLMKLISSEEFSLKEKERKDRAYWIALYIECKNAVIKEKTGSF